MRIGLDLDGVIVDSLPTWIRVLNRRPGVGRTYTLDEYPETHGDPETAAWCDEHEVEMAILPRPVPGAREAIARLRAAGHELVVITARAPRLRGLTAAWLEYHGIPVDRLHFLEGGSKVPAARAERLDAMVEDAPHNALALAEAGVPVLLFAAPYNRGVAHPLIRRCEGWAEVLARLGAGRGAAAM